MPITRKSGTKTVTLYLVGRDAADATKRPAFTSRREAQLYITDLDVRDAHIWMLTASLDLSGLELVQHAAMPSPFTPPGQDTK